MTTTQPKPSVLIVEDEPGPRDALKVILRPFFNIFAAEDGHTALSTLRSHAIDLITLDQKLPDVKGIDLLQDIKQERSNVEVIIITGYGSLKSAMEGIRYGAAGYLLKPFNITELITLINQTLEKKQRLDFLRSFLKESEGVFAEESRLTQTWEQVSKQYSIVTQGKQDLSSHLGKRFGLVPLLSDLIEAKGRHLYNHASRVSFYSTLLANQLDLSSEQQKSLAIGAFLHDIGHLAFESTSTSHPGPLTQQEQDELKRHPEIGAKMVAPLGLSPDIQNIISYHHEWLDGSGFPFGLRGDRIPQLAQIVSIAQTFDDLTVEHPNQQAIAIVDAVNQIQLYSGIHFDPQLVDVFSKVIHQCKTSLPALALSSNPVAMPNLDDRF